MVEVTNFTTCPCRLFVKLENQNPGGSIKDRMAVAMVDAAEQSGQLKAAESPAIQTTASQINPSPINPGRAAAFLNTTSQCVEMISGCFERLENSSEPVVSVLETYQRGLRTLSAAARYQNCEELEEPVVRQLRILDAAVRDGVALSTEDRLSLRSAFQTARSVLDRLASDQEVSPVGVAAESPAKAPVDQPAVSSSTSTIRIEQNVSVSLTALPLGERSAA